MSKPISSPNCHLYRVSNTVTGEFYIGKHRGRIQNNYWGSGLRMQRYVKIHGCKDLVYEILAIAEEDYIFELEKKSYCCN